jgi:hypothetical protein
MWLFGGVLLPMMMNYWAFGDLRYINHNTIRYVGGVYYGIVSKCVYRSVLRKFRDGKVVFI